MNEEAILAMLKDPDVFDARVSVGNRWAYFDRRGEPEDHEWVVLTRPYRARHNRVLYRGNDGTEIVKALKGEGEYK